uniref:Uncharacterized protein n=1 Tax=Rhizophora mucronata TaxID=61149 RepID=A0A2P2QDA7_RHIMU
MMKSVHILPLILLSVLKCKPMTLFLL